MRRAPWAAAAATALALSAAPKAARADASTWFFIGGGDAVWSQEGAKLTSQGMMMIDAGLGTTPDAPIILGALFRVQPMVLNGADLAILGRAATGSFQRGRFGLALDAGAYERWWGTQSVGFTGDLVLAAPFGIQAQVGGEYGSDRAKTFMAVLGVDLLRLTVYRQFGLSHWPNPSPAEHVQGKLLSSFF